MLERRKSSIVAVGGTTHSAVLQIAWNSAKLWENGKHSHSAASSPSKKLLIEVTKVDAVEGGGGSEAVQWTQTAAAVTRS